MRSKIYSAGTTLAIALLAITIKSIAQQPAITTKAVAKPAVTSKSTVTSLTITKTTVNTNPVISIKPGVNIDTKVEPNVNVEQLKIEPKVNIAPLPTTIYLSPVKGIPVSEKTLARVQERAETRKPLRIEIREKRGVGVINIQKRAADPDSPSNPEVADMPPVAYGFREPQGQTRDTQQQQSTTTVEQIKDYSKTYDVDANDKLVIDNSFGDVTVHTWNRNEFKVDVHIKVTANEGDVTISDTKINSVISFKTKITQNGRSIFGARRTSSNIVVNYTVYMPVKNPLEITNRFGAITLPDMAGRVVINSEHGQLIAKALSSAGNIINVSYGSANIESLRESDLNTEYGSLVLVSADKLNANISYSSAKIGRIVISGNINTKYGGGLLIGDVSKTLKNLTINSDYTNVKLGINDNENANFDVTIHNGNFNYNKSSNIYIAQKDSGQNKNKWSPTQNFKGHVGKGNADKMIFINSSYSTVKFD